MTLSNAIELSIIVPIYNVDKYLSECLQSIYAIQDLSYEVLLINDGSTDLSSDIIKHFESMFSDITIVINQANRGLSAARNSGIAHASGQYLMFVDSDDWIDSKKIPDLIEYAIKNDLDLLHGRGERVIDSERCVLPIPDEILDLPICNGREYLNAYCHYASIKKRNFRPEVWLSFYKTELLLINEIRFYCGIYFEDELFLPNIILHCNRVKSIDVFFYNYRIRENSITTTFNNKHLLSKAKLVTEYIATMRKHHFYCSFLNGRMIGWCSESLQYIGFKPLFSLLFLRNKNKKDTCLLFYLFFKKCFYHFTAKFKP